jgi:kumamolisin
MAVRQVDQAFQAAAAAGRTICCASGDDGAHDEPGDGRAHVDFPASSPWVLGCGGTRVEARDGAITSEVVWNDLARGHGATGGGVSRLFAVPPWQLGAGVPPVAGGRKKGRGVPDVASLADPETPLVVVAPDRRLAGVGGTSAAAPMWAALIARVNQALGARAGFLNPILYGRAAGALRDITAGDNGAYRAGVGWDPCTGHGAPGAAQLVAALSSAPAPRATRRAAANAPST